MDEVILSVVCEGGVTVMAVGLLTAMRQIYRRLRPRGKRRVYKQSTNSISCASLQSGYQVTEPEPLPAVRARCEALWLLEALQEALASGNPQAVLRVQQMLESGFGTGQDSERTMQWAERAWAMQSSCMSLCNPEPQPSFPSSGEGPSLQATDSSSIPAVINPCSPSTQAAQAVSTASTVAKVAISGQSDSSMLMTHSLSQVLLISNAATATTLEADELWEDERSWGSWEDEPPPDDPDEEEETEAVTVVGGSYTGVGPMLTGSLLQLRGLAQHALSTSCD